MTGDERILEAIDQAALQQTSAELRANEHLTEIGKLVFAVGANEAAYEIAAASLEEPGCLEETAEAIDSTRASLVRAVEDAIREVKDSFKARHHQNRQRELLTHDIGSTDEV